MNSSDEFEFDEIDDNVLKELDAIEAAVIPARPNPAIPLPKPAVTRSSNAPSRIEIDLCDDSLDIEDDFQFNAADFEQLDSFVANVYGGRAKPLSFNLANTRQTTLTGQVLPRNLSMGATQIAPHMSRKQSRKTKKWDHTQFAKTGWRSTKLKGKDKGAAGNEEDEETNEFEQFPAPFVPGEPIPPMKLKPDNIAAKHWIFPLNQSRRDYQFNIVKASLFDNTIVALPTGMGKTFIAGCVMLNFYRWFPEGKVVFVAPTKPLVAQQVEASHRTCGIPGSDACEMTGTITKNARYELWKEKRVFYATPQTFINDLASDNCDPSSIVLLVVDEAHRGTGDYAYCQIIRFMQARNPHFRVLALTATPGGKPEDVQKLVDGLHISHIEIRDEQSLDLRQYIHHKDITEHIIPMDENINRVKDLLVKVMEKQAKPLRSRGLFHNTRMETLHPYGPQKKAFELQGPDRAFYKNLMNLSSLARAMGYLIEGSMSMCYNYLKELSIPSSNDGKRDNTKSLRDDPDFKATLNELEQQNARGLTMHPKLDKLRSIILDHFAQALDDDGKPQRETRAMVFATFREAVDDIVKALNVDAPLLKATQFIGQGADKKGQKGMKQSEQLDVIKRFKDGEFNILVATSIGEEGLDIGEVDLIICYDAQKTPIRMLQRTGRTGRKRDGIVHVLLSEEREKDHWAKSKDAYKCVQKTIIRGDDLELFGDVPRLLPDHIKPQCLEKVMEIQEYVREEPGKRKRSSKDGGPAKSKKKKRNDDVERNIPTGASTGFVPVSQLIMKGAARQPSKLMTAEEFDAAGESDSDDADLDAGLDIRRTQSAREVSHVKKKPKKARLKKAKSVATSAPTRPKQDLSFTQQGLDHSSDEDLEQFAAGLDGRILHKPRPLPTDLSDSEVELMPNTILNSHPSNSGTIELTDSELEPDSKAQPASAEIMDNSFVPSRAKRSRTDPVLDVDNSRTPDLTFMVAPPRPKRRKVEIELASSPMEAGSSRFQRERPSTQPPKAQKKNKHRPKGSATTNPLFDLEAEHSGDDVSAGSSESDEESESDRRFIHDSSSPTRQSPSYQQTQAYHLGLRTQMPGGPVFKNGPFKYGKFGPIRPTVHITSSPGRQSDKSEYEEDSFVVNDEASIVYSDDE